MVHNGNGYAWSHLFLLLIYQISKKLFKKIQALLHMNPKKIIFYIWPSKKNF